MATRVGMVIVAVAVAAVKGRERIGRDVAAGGGRGSIGDRGDERVVEWWCGSQTVGRGVAIAQFMILMYEVKVKI